MNLERKISRSTVRGLEAALILGACALAACGRSAEESGTPAAASTSQATAPAAPSNGTLPADAFLVLPGDYAQSTSVADLEARFGRTNVRKQTTPDPRIVLFPDDPSRRAYVTFHEAAAFKELALISVDDPGSRWRGKQGAHIGMTFATLRELNGKPFYYSGFDEQKRAWAHDGWSPSMSDDDATLGAFDVAENDHLYFSVEFGVRDPAQLEVTDLPVDENLLSDDARFPRLGERVVVTGLASNSSLDDEWE